MSSFHGSIWSGTHLPLFAPGDAELDLLASILTGGKNSRLYKRLVYELQIAQDVAAYQSSSKLSSTFAIVATARSGQALLKIKEIIDEEVNHFKRNGPTLREVERAVNQYESSFLSRLERVGGFSGKADLLNSYYFYTGNPDYFNEDLMRYKALDPSDIQSASQTYLTPGRVILSIVPQGKNELAVPPITK